MLRLALVIALSSMGLVACGLSAGSENENLEKKHKKPCGETDAGPGWPDAGIDWSDAGPWGSPDGGTDDSDAGPYVPDAGFDW